MSRSIRKSFRKKPKGQKAPLWEEALANLNALVKKNPETVDEKKMNVLVSAMIELQQEYRESVAHCEKLKGKVAELTKEVEDKDKLLQERSLQIEAAHFRISGLTYLERSEKEKDEEEEEKKSDEDEPSGNANDSVQFEAHSLDQKAGGVRRPPRPEGTTEVLEDNYTRDKLNGNAYKRGTSPMGMGMVMNATPWQPPYFGSPVKQRVFVPPDASTDMTSSIQDTSVSNVVEIVETLEI